MSVPERVKYGLRHLSTCKHPLPTLPKPPLHCHPSGTCRAVRTFEVAVDMTERAELVLRYCLSGDSSALSLPAAQPHAATDGLWQHTCCEAFIAVPDSPAYREFNFSPSGQWAVYDFAAYRQRDPRFSPKIAPRLSFAATDSGFELIAVIPPELLPAGDSWQIGLTAVLEAADGGKTYWALTHAASQPDFHLRQSFSLPLKVSPP
jgi:hypothetical protein